MTGYKQMLPDIKFELNALKTWIAAASAHLLFLVIILYVNLNRPYETQQTVEVGVLPESFQKESVKETFLPNPPKDKPQDVLPKTKTTNTKT